jgi:hypothetical protein
MKHFGTLDDNAMAALRELQEATEGLRVRRANPAKSSTPFPNSTDLEKALLPILGARGFQHHVWFQHPRTGDRFEYDFWRPSDGMAMEIMGYRADDEVYKDILKFHVHSDTRIGVVWVPRWKWITNRRTATNLAATVKALAFADTYMNVQALVALPYDWREGGDDGTWSLLHIME